MYGRLFSTLLGVKIADKVEASCLHVDIQEGLDK